MSKLSASCFKLVLLQCVCLLSFPAKAELVDSYGIYRHSITNTHWEQTARDISVYDNPYKISLFSAAQGEDSARLWSQTKSVGAYGLGVAGFLALLPSELTHWEKSDVNLLDKWRDNVRGGPVWDRAVCGINYIGHPYFGGVYYQAARKSGYRQWDAFVYSFLMSTFYWEYGVEAFAETPSIQDLVVTPVLGWVYGEWAFNKEREIILGGGTVLGSERLGNTTLFFLDPIDSIGRGINSLIGKEVIKAGTGHVEFQTVAMSDGRQDKQFRFSVQYAIGTGKDIDGSIRHWDRQEITTNDPVDFGIVGLSFGSGYFGPDAEWDVDSGWGGNASLGLYFSRRFSARLSYGRAELKHLQSRRKITFENYSLDGQYYLFTQHNLRPFLTLGFGESMKEMDLKQKAFQVNTGVGLHYRLSPNWALQTDWRRYHSAKLMAQDDLISARVVYRFGRGEG